MTSREIAALFVDVKKGPYARMKGVDAWGVRRDAMKYQGSAPVIAHPPCGPWGRFWWRYTGREGTAQAAIRAVRVIRRNGGVLEHPAGSNLWDDANRYAASVGRSMQQGVGKVRDRGLFDLPRPGDPPDRWGGYTIKVDQVDWGHPTRKPTWLYIVGVPRHQLPPRPPPGTPTHEVTTKGAARGSLPELRKSLRHITPPKFAAWLREIALRVEPPRRG